MSAVGPHCENGAGVLDKLTKCLELTTSNHDGEALVAIRKANCLRERLQVTWHDLITSPGHPGSTTPPIDDNENWEAVFETIRRYNMPGPKWRPILESLYEFWRSRGYLTEKQQRVVRKFHDTALRTMSGGAP